MRVLVRDKTRISGRPWSQQVDVRIGDLKDIHSLEGLCEGIEVAYYLVHSMVNDKDSAVADLVCSRNFSNIAASHLKHCIYLGGLLPEEQQVSKHLRSRAEVGETLRQSLLLTEFRAGPIIGSGSASFEMVRYLTERLPIMLTPLWIHNQVQPINVRAVLDYLVAALDHAPLGVVDIGGEVLTFKDMMMGYAQARGLKRKVITMPVLTPGLAARWVGLITPITNSLARPLVLGIVTPVLADTRRAQELFPDISPFRYIKSVQLALQKTREKAVATRWSSSLAGASNFSLQDQEGLVSEVRSTFVPTDPEFVFSSFSAIGGERGWLVWNWAWRIRGLLDQILGGPGLRRGRRHPIELLAGEVLDFWRVEQVEPGRRLVLRAEMKVPGKAWLSWEARPVEGGCELVQTALFEPRGLWGAIYWYAMYPAHQFIFSDMCDALARDALKLAHGETLV